MKYSILFIFVSIIFSCNQSQNNDSITKDNNKKLYNLLFKNPKIKDNLIKLFAIDKSETSKVLKILISRRNSFIRITIYQIFSKTEINDPPINIINYNGNVFLYYNSSELIFENHMEKNELGEVLKKLNIKFKELDSTIQDTRVLQFDLFPNKEFKLNFPAISPFDEDDREINFK